MQLLQTQRRSLTRVRVCGIDPGNTGAIGVLDSNDPAYLALLDLKSNSIYEATKWLHQHQVDKVWVEDVHSLYGMSAKSNFGFGRSLGIARTISEIVTKGVVADTVTPKTWQKYIGVTQKGPAIKKEVAQIAISLYPGANLYGPKGGLRDGRSDALMIAHYGLHN